ncbi:MAG: hypothetical protein WBX15_17855 [Thermoanaerobaculia bacterium]
MKRALIAVLALLFPLVLLAQDADRDVLLTPDGTLYTIESVDPLAVGVDSISQRVLQLRVQNGTDVTNTYVPDSLSGGMHTSPSLAWDSQSKTLFIFWQKQPNLMSSELLLCSYHDSTWSDTTSIDNGSFHIRFNLQIGVTRYAQSTDENGNRIEVPRLIVHAVWWDQTGYGENGRYAMISIKDGRVAGIDIHDLLYWVDSTRQRPAAELPADFDRDLFRHPAIFVQSSLDAIDIVFADWDRNRLERLYLRPVTAEGQLELPVGIWRGEIDPPGLFRREADSKITALAGSDTTKLIYYYRDGDALRYIMRKDGAWSDMMTLQLNDNVSAGLGAQALHRMIASE